MWRWFSGGMGPAPFPGAARQFSKPLTGNREIALQHSRDKRIFADGTGLRAARNPKEFLLQTYMRDTGEILWDLSLPLMVQGRHWGALRLDFDPGVVREAVC